MVFSDSQDGSHLLALSLSLHVYMGAGSCTFAPLDNPAEPNKNSHFSYKRQLGQVALKTSVKAYS